MLQALPAVLVEKNSVMWRTKLSHSIRQEGRQANIRYAQISKKKSIYIYMVIWYLHATSSSTTAQCVWSSSFIVVQQIFSSGTRLLLYYWTTWYSESGHLLQSSFSFTAHNVFSPPGCFQLYPSVLL